MTTKLKSLNSSQKQALGWAKARGGKITRYGASAWKPGLLRSETRIIGHNTILSLIRRGNLKESGWRDGFCCEVEVVPDDEVIAPETVTMEPKASYAGVYLKRHYK